MREKDNVKQEMDDRDFAIPRRNLPYIIAGFAIMVLGYILMCGGGSKETTEFNYAMFSFSRITLAPVVILIGIVVEIVAIMRIKKR